MNYIYSTILSQINLSGDNYLLDLYAPEIAKQSLPGQFVEVSTAGSTLLNKPISIASISNDKKSFSIVYKVVGVGTKAISNFTQNQKIKIIGPCGNGFPKPGKQAILVGGGVGIPPLFFLAQSFPDTEFHAVLGAGTKNDLVLKHEFTKLKNINVKIATDDGSDGRKGTVIPLLKETLHKENMTVFACGPSAMLSAVAKTCKTVNSCAYVSLEAYMGCGIGVCMGCVIPTIRGLERVCREGPVFGANEIIWEKM